MSYICVCVEEEEEEENKADPSCTKLIAEKVEVVREVTGNSLLPITSPAACPCHRIPKSSESVARATAVMEGAARKTRSQYDGVGGGGGSTAC